MLNSNSTALLSTLRKQHHIFSTFAPDEDDVENCRTLEFKSKLRHELSSKEQEKIDVYTGISTDEKKKDKHVKDMRIFSGTTFCQLDIYISIFQERDYELEKIDWRLLLCLFSDLGRIPEGNWEHELELHITEKSRYH